MIDSLSGCCAAWHQRCDEVGLSSACMSDWYKATFPPSQVVRAPVLGCGADWSVRCQTSETCTDVIFYDEPGTAAGIAGGTGDGEVT